MGRSKNSGENSNDTNFPNVSILLKDGTELNVVQNGTTYESGEVINRALLTDENLSQIQIDGVTYILVPAGESVTVNGVEISTKTEE